MTKLIRRLIVCDCFHQYQWTRKIIRQAESEEKLIESNVQPHPKMEYHWKRRFTELDVERQEQLAKDTEGKRRRRQSESGQERVQRLSQQAQRQRHQPFVSPPSTTVSNSSGFCHGDQQKSGANISTRRSLRKKFDICARSTLCRLFPSSIDEWP